MSAKKKAANDWLAEIMQAENIKSTADDVPEGWKTLDEIALQMGLGRAGAQAKVRRWMETGFAERKQFRIFVSNGGLRLVWHYNRVL